MAENIILRALNVGATIDSGFILGIGVLDALVVISVANAKSVATLSLLL
jgi:hypothetical protein